MATDVPTWECVNHFYGPPVPCACRRFYPTTDCDPPRFFKFDFEDLQGDFEWLFLNSNEWQECRKPVTATCEWRWNWYQIGDPGLVNTIYVDNPSFDGEDTTPQFLCKITVKNDDMLGLPLSYTATIPFGAPNSPILRDHAWTVEESDWVQTQGNPFANPPTGDAVFTPELCQPGWTEPPHAPS